MQLTLIWLFPATKNIILRDHTEYLLLQKNQFRAHCQISVEAFAITLYLLAFPLENMSENFPFPPPTVVVHNTL